MSTLPFLFGLQVLFLLTLGWRSGASALAAMVIIAGALAACGAGSTWLAWNGIYDAPWFLNLLPGLWLPTIPFLIVGLLMVIPFVRRAVLAIADETPASWFVGIQVLRIAALGTLIKTFTNEFPLEVELAIGITDLAFGLSAILIWRWLRTGRLSQDAVALWHFVGVAIIVLPGEIAMQSGLPGPWQVYSNPPTSAVMLDWPMVLAPSLVVPVFLLLNLFGATAIIRQTQQQKEQLQ